MGLLVLTGRLANILSRGRVTSSQDDQDFPQRHLFDNDPGTVFAFSPGIDTVEELFTVDGDLGKGTGSFETAFVDGAPTGWTDDSVVDGELVQEDTIVVEGTYSLRINTPATPFSEGKTHKDYTTRAGETLRLHFKYAVQSNSQLRAQLQDLETGQWLNDDFEWQDSETDFLVQGATGGNPDFGTFNELITVSSMLYWAKPIRRLRLTFKGLIATSGDASVYLDHVYIVPAYDMLTVVGHSLRPASGMDWYGAHEEDFSDQVLLASMTPGIDKFYQRLAAAVTYRYQRFFIGPQPEGIWLGEAIIGKGLHFEKTAVSPIPTIHDGARVEVPRMLGGMFVGGLARTPRLDKTLSFQFPDEPDTAETGLWRVWHDEVYLRSLQGDPAVIVPTTDRQEVLFGHVSGTIKEQDGAPGQAGYKLLEGFVVMELPLPVELPGFLTEGVS